MKLFKYETLGSQIAFIKAVERFAEEVVRLALPESVFGRRFRTVRRQFAGLSSAPQERLYRRWLRKSATRRPTPEPESSAF
jgi:hypothetical protein